MVERTGALRVTTTDVLLDIVLNDCRVRASRIFYPRDFVDYFNGIYILLVDPCSAKGIQHHL